VRAARGSQTPPTKLSQLAIEPLFSPRLNQLTRSAAVPWVKDSGTTQRCSPLQRVVTDRCGGGQRRLHIARIEDVAGLSGVTRPHAGAACSSSRTDSWLA